VLFTHPDIADAAVIGVHSDKEATELPRWGAKLFDLIIIKPLQGIRRSCPT
jgi:hypothetical protein